MSSSPFVLYIISLLFFPLHLPLTFHVINVHPYPFLRVPLIVPLSNQKIVPDKCLDRLCGRIRLLLIQLLELCPINKCKLRAYKYRDCCGNVRTLCAPKAPDIVSVLLQIILCDSDLFVEGVGPINILGNELLCFVFGIIKRLITYAPPPRLGCVWKGPCQAKKCTSDPVCGRGCENDDCARSSPAGTCERDPFNPFGTFAYWNCRKRKEFEENQKKENEATIAEEEGGRKREAESFENVAGRLRAAIELQNKEQEKEDEEKEKETEDEEDSSGARIRRKAPLPSRPVKDALPRIKVPLPAPRGVSLDEMPLEPDMKDLVKVRSEYHKRERERRRRRRRRRECVYK